LHGVGTGLVAAGENWGIHALGGIRYAELDETVRLGVEQMSSTRGLFDGTPTPAGSVYRGQDNFHCRNQFFGALIGGTGAWHYGDFVISARAQVSLGVSHEQVNIHGVGFVTTPSGALTSTMTDILAQHTNIGGHSKDEFGFLPEAGLTVGYQVTENIRLFVGYDVFYWTGVARPGDQIDRHTNPNLVPFIGNATRTTLPGPSVTLSSSDFWAQGLNCGFHLTF
jgi:hypothetical protein